MARPKKVYEEERAKANAEFLISARTALGEKWGLGRPLSRAELARALDLSDDHGGSHISKMEAWQSERAPDVSGPIRVAIRMMLEGGVPYTADGIVKPGYPRRTV